MSLRCCSSESRVENRSLRSISTSSRQSLYPSHMQHSSDRASSPLLQPHPHRSRRWRSRSATISIVALALAVRAVSVVTPASSAISLTLRYPTPHVQPACVRPNRVAVAAKAAVAHSILLPLHPSARTMQINRRRSRSSDGGRSSIRQQHSGPSPRSLALLDRTRSLLSIR